MEYKVKAGSGKFNILDRAYKKLIDDIHINLDEAKKERWETYDIIITELINSNNEVLFEELKYRVTDGENLNQVILDLIDRMEDSESILFFLRRRIEDYLDEDFFDRFY